MVSVIVSLSEVFSFGISGGFSWRAVRALSEANFLPFLMFFVLVNHNNHHCLGSLFLL